MRFSRMILQIRWIFIIKSQKITKRSPEIAILVKKYEIFDFGGSFDIFFNFFAGHFLRESFYFRSKNYQKILEKREMSFRSFENKNWTFQGSFDNFSPFFRYFLGIFDSIYIFLSENERVFIAACMMQWNDGKTRNNEWNE